MALKNAIFKDYQLFCAGLAAVALEQLNSKLSVLSGPVQFSITV
jgi:hypothetical protein